MANLKTNSSVISFLILLSLQHFSPLHVTSYTPIDHFSINCGSTNSQTSLDNPNWTADTDSKPLATVEPQNPSLNTAPYSTSRLSRSEFSYSFPVTAGPKLLRLYFYPSSHPGFNRYDSLFSVKANNYTLLNNFNASLHADNHANPAGTFTREYCINVEPSHRLNITLTPSSTTHPKAYAFINGIEVVSILNDLHQALINGTCEKTALETVHRINVGENKSNVIFKLSNSNNNFESTSNNPSQLHTSKKKSIKTPIIACVIVGASLFVLLFIVGFLIFRCARRVAAARDRNPEPSSTRCRDFSLAEIRAATKNFDEGLIVGKGGFGNVYKGHIDTCRKPVAIKRLKPGSDQGAHEFQTEIKMLSRFRHANLVSLIGYCNDGGEMILVYDFMPRGTLRDHLYGSEHALPWDRRLSICLEAARGIEFLHAGVDRQSVIHRDVKSTNILLDEDWVAKVSDFGLSKVGANASHVTTDVKGSFGYLDPEYYMSLWLTQKSDVYSFGVVLLEVLCGRGPTERKVEKHEEFLVAWVKRCFRDGVVDRTVDPALRGSIRPKCLNKFVEIAISCLNDHGKQRPMMRDVVKGLEYALNLQRCGGGGTPVRRKGKNENMEIGLTKIERHDCQELVFDEKFGKVMNASSSCSKATTTCSEDEQALVHGIFPELGNQSAR